MDIKKQEELMTLGWENNYLYKDNEGNICVWSESLARYILTVFKYRYYYTDLTACKKLQIHENGEYKTISPTIPYLKEIISSFVPMGVQTRTTMIDNTLEYLKGLIVIEKD